MRLRGADGFALLDFAEAERVRALGWRGPILLLEGCFERATSRLCSRLSLWHAVHCEEQIDWLAAHKTAPAAQRLPEAEQRHEPARLHAGAPSAPPGCASTRCAQVDEITLMTHLSDADGDRGVAASSLRSPCSTRRPPTCPANARSSNSAATLRFGARLAAARRGDWVRPGIMLYGVVARLLRRTAPPTGSCARR